MPYSPATAPSLDHSLSAPQEIGIASARAEINRLCRGEGTLIIEKVKGLTQDLIARTTAPFKLEDPLSDDQVRAERREALLALRDDANALNQIKGVVAEAMGKTTKTGSLANKLASQGNDVQERGEKLKVSGVDLFRAIISQLVDTSYPATAA